MPSGRLDASAAAFDAPTLHEYPGIFEQPGKLTDWSLRIRMPNSLHLSMSEKGSLEMNPYEVLEMTASAVSRTSPDLPFSQTCGCWLIASAISTEFCRIDASYPLIAMSCA